MWSLEGEQGSEESGPITSHLQRQRLRKPENKNIIVLDSEGIVCASFKVRSSPFVVVLHPTRCTHCTR
jgi:hypothetical protein